MTKAFNILTINKISPLGLKRFPAGRYVVGPDIKEPDAIMVRSQNLLEMEIPASVKAIARAGAGTNNVPVAKMSARGVPVFNAAGANANAVKELIITGMLLSSRNILQALNFTNGLTGDDATLHKLVEAGKANYAGIELRGRTLGIIGLGAIGRLVADAAIGLGMQVVGFDPEITVDAAWGLSSQVKKAHSVEELLKQSDFVTLHVPLLDATRGLINEKRVQAMKPGSVLLNFSRDAIVDEDAVIAGLASKHLRNYVCDFPSEKNRGNPAVISLPHLGASTQEAEENCAVMVAEQLRDYLEHGNLFNTVNFPNVSMPRESSFRISIANANVPNMLGQISTALAAAGINIHNMLNKSRGEMAYTLVDTDSAIPAAVIAQLAAIPGVLMVRDLPLES
ncbi:MAG: 3-phosphoglycerate dehydrogenase [Gallionellales bacterium 35-53-114]|jgi:D-3-phosphoglycerate dehydrogenase|nr:MAG: 3-phosphoglycerate dehydrogenase [Gallionellales bacterium 35-53-114]OYZ65340.1 MAG: 3-phosphoglycerate dehydrogenase [Gallionellales bacterium 24-53-125]OZB08247.1 MAG: 3-phosphoglycerate dehydrogenase [Gallionellales bacterium 39-52-133]HQS58177.1 phosphoglycerate dehydrogenase [Gallionellaceae bacterium]HQS73732.1 phosphoglycerate dehydrogenase [Gallionellaceae bacterium]